MRRAAMAVVTAVLVLGPAMVGVTGAGACSLAAPGPTEDELVARADLIFDGVAVSSQDPNAGQPIVGSGDPVAWTFTVLQPVKGPVATPQQEVTTARSDASCGVGFQVGRSYRVYAQLVGGRYVAGLGNGTRPLDQAPPAPASTTTSSTSTTSAPPPTGTSVAPRTGSLALTG